MRALSSLHGVSIDRLWSLVIQHIRRDGTTTAAAATGAVAEAAAISTSYGCFLCVSRPNTDIAKTGPATLKTFAVQKAMIQEQLGDTHRCASLAHRCCRGVSDAMRDQLPVPSALPLPV